VILDAVGSVNGLLIGFNRKNRLVLDVALLAW
jgi:hypothetical protein